MVYISDSKFIGELRVMKDCFTDNYCKNDPEHYLCIDKTAVLIPYTSTSGKVVFPRSATAFPLWAPSSEASFYGKAEIFRVTFDRFQKATTQCGKKQTIFAANPRGADKHPPTFVSTSVFNNVHTDAFAYMFSPPIEWAVIDDCGYFPCTGPKNILAKFDGIQFSGTVRPDFSYNEFQVVSNNPEFMQYVPDCWFYDQWNAYLCINYKLDLLIFESMDLDKWDRSFTPVTLVNLATNQTSVMNQFMDHVWDGFYTGQKRLSRFITLVEAGEEYEILYTGTAPGLQQFYTSDIEGGITLKIKYDKPGSYKVKENNGQVHEGNGFDDATGQVKAIPKGSATCGMNRFVGVENYLEFYMNRGCHLIIGPQGQILTKIRLSWTLEEFYADGGTTKFVNRLAGALGVHAADMKVVAVYKGSVVVEVSYQTDSIREMSAFKRKLRKGA